MMQIYLAKVGVTEKILVLNQFITRFNLHNTKEDVSLSFESFQLESLPFESLLIEFLNEDSSIHSSPSLITLISHPYSPPQVNNDLNDLLKSISNLNLS